MASPTLFRPTAYRNDDPAAIYGVWPRLVVQTCLIIRVADPDAFLALEDTMTDLISRTALLSALRSERDAYFSEHFAQDPATGTYEASNAKEEYLAELDERIEWVEGFPAVDPVATLVNNNQPGWQNIVETAPNVTIDVGTKLYRAA